jgi:hypothetical protein
MCSANSSTVHPSVAHQTDGTLMKRALTLLAVETVVPHAIDRLRALFPAGF